MTNVVYTILFTKIVRFGSCKAQCNLNFSTFKSKYESISSSTSNSIILTYSLKRIKYQKLRFLSSKTESGDTNKSPEVDNEENDSSQHCDRSSSTIHGQFRRKIYETKRSTYNERNSEEASNSKDGDGAGLSELTKQMDHYQRLNIEQDADQTTIKSAYYSLSKVYHPDVVGSNDANAVENFRLITESYDILSNPAERLDYDRQLNSNKRSMMDLNECRVGNWSNGTRFNRKYDTIYRAPDADSIFRFRQDHALAREKLRNPRKFRAGSFKTSIFESVDDNQWTQIKIKNLSRQMSKLNSSKSSSSAHDGYEFYRKHLHNTLSRKQADLINANTSFDHLRARSHYSTYSQKTELVGLGIAIGSILVICLLLINHLMSFDVAAFLDKKLEDAMKKDDSKKKADEERP